MFRQHDHGDTDWVSAIGLMAAHAPIGPVTRHRLMQIRHRLALGHYPLDPLALASEIVALAGDGRSGVHAVQQPAARLLAAAIDRIEPRSVLLLQLEFVEQLRADEIALVMDDGPATIATLRRTALLQLSTCLDEADVATLARVAPIAGGGVSR